MTYLTDDEFHMKRVKLKSRIMNDESNSATNELISKNRRIAPTDDLVKRNRAKEFH